MEAGLLGGLFESITKVVASDKIFQQTRMEYMWISTTSYVDINRLACSFSGNIRASIQTSNQSSSTINNAIKFSHFRDNVEIKTYYLDSYSSITNIEYDFTDVKAKDVLVISVMAKSSSSMVKITSCSFKGDFE